MPSNLYHRYHPASFPYGVSDSSPTLLLRGSNEQAIARLICFVFGICKDLLMLTCWCVKIADLQKLMCQFHGMFPIAASWLRARIATWDKVSTACPAGSRMAWMFAGISCCNARGILLGHSEVPGVARQFGNTCNLCDSPAMYNHVQPFYSPKVRWSHKIEPTDHGGGPLAAQVTSATTRSSRANLWKVWWLCFTNRDLWFWREKVQPVSSHSGLHSRLDYIDKFFSVPHWCIKPHRVHV